MDDEFTCEARVRFRGEDLHLNRIIARFDLQEILPPRNPPMDPMDLSLVQQASERRRRFVDMIAAEFAHTLTEALFKRAGSGR